MATQEQRDGINELAHMLAAVGERAKALGFGLDSSPSLILTLDGDWNQLGCDWVTQYPPSAPNSAAAIGGWFCNGCMMMIVVRYPLDGGDNG